jgi:flagellin-specific chaperone FliS
MRDKQWTLGLINGAIDLTKEANRLLSERRIEETHDKLERIIQVLEIDKNKLLKATK